MRIKQNAARPCMRSLWRLPGAVLLAVALAAMPACDSQKSDDIPNAIDCYILSLCFQENTRFGMVGDSWTDFGLGIQIQRDLRDWLEVSHGYNMTEVVLAGQTLEADLNRARGFQRVIERAGPELAYMLISLGGNDLLDNINEYGSAADPNTVLDARLNAYEANLRNMIAQGDFLKIQMYGGEPLTWILHGYDYANPEKVSGCNLTTGSFSAAQKDTLFQTNLDQYNIRQQAIAASMNNVLHIDLRGTLGGPPTSNPGLKIDCIHPNDPGFEIIASRYAAGLQLITQER
ncbi:MAG: SGNH/GDSL hydrolase family protein [bacterium]|nr:SGNH/GDSL hydrolase family protein [bacterium]